MKTNLLRTLSLALSATSLISLCSCSPGTIGMAQRDATASDLDQQRYLDKSKEPAPAVSPGRVSETNDLFIPMEVVRQTHGEDLPDIRLTIRTTSPQTIQQIAQTLTQAIQRQVDVSISISPDITESAQNGSSGSSEQNSITTDAIDQAIGQYANSNGQNVSNIVNGMYVAQPDTATTMSLHFKDTRLKQILNLICAHFHITYTYDGTQILFSKNITRTFSIHAIPTSTSLSSTLSGTGMNQSSGGGGGGGGGGGQTGSKSNNTQTVGSTYQSNVWTEIVQGVAELAEKHSGYVSSSPTTGTITVTAEPSVIDTIQSFIDQQNAIMDNMITIDFQIIDETFSNADTDSFNMAQLIKTGADSIGMGGVSSNGIPGVMSAITPYASAITALNNIGQGNSGDGGSSSSSSSTSWSTLLNQSSASSATSSPGMSIYNGKTSAIIKALSTMGRIINRHEIAVTTQNGFVAPFESTNTRTYVAEASVTNTGSSTSGSQTSSSLVPGTVITGFNLAVIPRIDLLRRTVMLQYGISISSLEGSDNGFTNYTSADGSISIQEANIDTNSYINNAIIPDAATMILTGYSYKTSSASKTGSGTPSFWGLGGSQSGTVQRVSSIILVTPTVIKIQPPKAN